MKFMKLMYMWVHTHTHMHTCASSKQAFVRGSGTGLKPVLLRLQLPLSVPCFTVEYDFAVVDFL